MSVFVNTEDISKQAELGITREVIPANKQNWPSQEKSYRVVSSNGEVMLYCANPLHFACRDGPIVVRAAFHPPP